MDEDSITTSKVSGYLEKKSKMKMMNSYKRYWFVLEGRLLLYYRSKDEYETLSPCKGSINLGPPCNVKSCPSTSGTYVFQIETRATTITLRANNREDQNRWMQGIMSALNQNLNATKLSHFRYSLDELPQQKQSKSILKRKNTIPPHSHPSKNQSNKDKGIIQRLQKIGAHSYCGSTGTITQIANNYRNVNNSKQTNVSNFERSVLVENDQYGIINKNNDSKQVEIRKHPNKPENIYERISGDSSLSINSKEISYGIPNKNNTNTFCVENPRPSTFLIENETYCGIQTEEENKITQTSFVMENNHYYSVDKIITFPNTDAEVVYAEPKCSEVIDHNENNLILNKLKREENAYSVTKLYDSEHNNNNGNYDIKVENDTKSKSKCKKEKTKKQPKETNKETKGMKLKKSSSFIKRVWKKKTKHKETEESIEELYETVPESVVEKVGPTDDTAVQMLSELQNILENKKSFLQEQCSKPCNENENDSSTNQNTNFPMDKAATVQMLLELQSILKDKTTVSNETPIECSSTTESPTFNENDPDTPSCSSGSEQICPFLPPKQQKTHVPSPYHDIPKNNHPVHKTLPPRRKRGTETVRSLDEILDDLEKENDDDFNKYKMKKLIQRFSGEDDDNVELRNNNTRFDALKEDVNSNELNRLLNELAKVTCAPLLTPGVTSSLISPILRDEELLKLLPTHRRRHSEPDYDIPRPHTHLPREEIAPENAIGSTRFFGPVLKASDIVMKQDTNVEDSPQLLSMTPDSLEPEPQLVRLTAASRLSEEENTYISHNYLQLKSFNDGLVNKKIVATNFESSMERLDEMITNDIYAHPKSFVTEVKEENVDVFIDSLEICDNNSFTEHNDSLS